MCGIIRSSGGKSENGAIQRLVDICSNRRKREKMPHRAKGHNKPRHRTHVVKPQSLAATSAVVVGKITNKVFTPQPLNVVFEPKK